jgi:hypothetical protein
MARLDRAISGNGTADTPEDDGLRDGPIKSGHDENNKGEIDDTA